MPSTPGVSLLARTRTASRTCSKVCRDRVRSREGQGVSERGRRATASLRQSRRRAASVPVALPPRRCTRGGPSTCGRLRVRDVRPGSTCDASVSATGSCDQCRRRGWMRRYPLVEKASGPSRALHEPHRAPCRRARPAGRHGGATVGRRADRRAPRGSSRHSGHVPFITDARLGILHHRGPESSRTSLARPAAAVRSWPRRLGSGSGSHTQMYVSAAAVRKPNLAAAQGGQ